MSTMMVFISFLVYIYKIHSRLFPFMVGISLEYATIFLDSSNRANIVIIASEHDSVESDFTRLYDRESEHLGGISFSSFTWAYTIPDMSTIISEIRMVY